VGTHCLAGLGKEDGGLLHACKRGNDGGWLQTGDEAGVLCAEDALSGLGCVEAGSVFGDKGWNTTDVTSTLHSANMGTNGGRASCVSTIVFHVWEASRFTKRATAQFLNRAASAPASNSARDIGRLVR
jgi:hypothetical protein